MYFHLHRNSEKCTFYSVKILAFQSVGVEILKSGPFCCVKFFKMGLF